MENLKEIRAIGNASEEHKEETKEKIWKTLCFPLHSFPEEQKEKLIKFEIPKTEQEIEIIGRVQDKLHEMVKESGAEPYDIPLENFHIVPSDLYHEIDKTNSHATSMASRQTIFFHAPSVKNYPFFFATLCAHEVTHIFGDMTLEVNECTEDDGRSKIDFSKFREGWSVNSSQKKTKENKQHSHFDGVHEGIASLAQEKIIPFLLTLPMFAEEKKWRESDEGKSAWINMEKKYGKYGIEEREILWINPKNTEECRGLGYMEQIRTLEYVFEEMRKQFPEKYATRNDVYKEFLKTQFTGRLLPIAREMERIFGKESFRRLGDMGIDKNSGIATLEALQKNRLQVIRDAKSKTAV
jgi:hypothetical protein